MHTSLASAVLAALLFASGCIHVLERVERSEEPVGEAKVVDQREVERTPAAAAELRGDKLQVRLWERVACERLVEQEVERTERVRRYLEPSSYIVMAGELVGALVAFSLLAQASWAMVPEDHYGWTEPELITIMVASGAGGSALLGLFGFQLYYLFDEGSRRSSAHDRAWGAPADCDQRPLKEVEFQADVGAVELRATTDAAGRATLSAPQGIDLRSLLAGAGWSFPLQIEQLRATLTVQVTEPGDDAPPVQEPPPAPASKPAAGEKGNQPPIPDGPPAGGPTLPPASSDAGAAEQG